MYPLASLSVGFALEKLGFASERHGFASERQGFWLRQMPLPPKRFLALTCTIWLRLQFRGLDSAWFSSAHLLIFHAQGRMLEPRIGFWIPGFDFGSPGRHFGPGTLYGQFWGLEKSGFAMKLFCGGLAGESILPK